MKYIPIDTLNSLPGRRLAETESFTFDCRPGIACFNQCCRNLNLFLYPYDVIRLKHRLGLSSDRFIDDYLAVVLRPGSFFPEVLLRMRDEQGGHCPFVTAAGCSVYHDRPDTCRKFPLEQAVLYGSGRGKTERIYFFRPPDFCRGPLEPKPCTPAGWARTPDDLCYDRLTLEWAELKALFLKDPWGPEGPEGPKAKMAFMAAYNIDSFRRFIFGSSFLKRYKIGTERLKKIETEDIELLKLAFAWIRFYLWGIKSSLFRPR